MKRPGGWTVGALLLATTAWSQDAGVSDPAGEEVRQVILARKAASARGDLTEWSRHIAEDSIWVDEGKHRLTRKDVANENANTLPGSVRGDMLDFEVRVEGDVAVATYRFEEHSVHNGKPVTERYRFLDTYVRRGGSWVLVACSETPTTPVPEVARAVKVDRRLLDTYAGTYQWVPGQVLVIARKGDGLTAQATGEAEASALFAEDEHTFFDEGQSWRWIFRPDKTGKVPLLVFRKHGNDYELPRVTPPPR